MAFGLYWNVQGGTVDIELPVTDPGLREIYFSEPPAVKTPFSFKAGRDGSEPDGISAILADCVRTVTAERIMLYIESSRR